jgi:hypothetical protein
MFRTDYSIKSRDVAIGTAPLIAAAAHYLMAGVPSAKIPDEGPDFARGERKTPIPDEGPDFARGERKTPIPDEEPDFARGERKTDD